MLNAKVVIGYIIYENPSNGYKVVQFDIRNSSDISINKIRVSGVMKDIQKNFEYEIEVIPSTNLKYKDSFELASIKLSLDLTKERTIKFFASKIFSGIGKIGAENIVDSIGDNAAKLLEKNILLLEKTKLSNEQKEAIISFYDESNGKGQVYKIFNEASLTVNDADEILKIQSPKIFLKKIETDPYYLIYSVTTNFFKSLDSIARVLDIESNDGRRIRAVIFTYLTRNLDNSGDSLINKEEFQIQILKKYYWIQENEYLYNKNYLIKNKFLFENEYNISTSILNKGEKNIYQTINHLSRIIPRYKKVKIGSLPLDEIQISALEHSLNNSFSIILGGPGTGKTTILNDLLESLKTNTTLLSYTGKAVNAINEKLFMDSNIKATTIHKFLRYSKDTLSFDLEPRDDIDTLIIDEFSMVPTILFSTVLSVLPHLERIILLGDENQIPSITSGNLLRDFIREFPNNIVKLEKNYRQDESSSIIFDAALINDMKRPLFNSKSSILKEYDPFDENEMHRSIIKNFFIDKENTVVLCPVYKGINGINFLNQEIKNKIFENSKGIQFQDNIFYKGEKIMQLSNDTEKNVFNGEVGFIEDFIQRKVDGKKEFFVIVNYNDKKIEYKRGEFSNETTNAYAMSVHKSQGSEYKKVIIVIPGSNPFNMDKKLFYTGVTRARKKLVVFGSFIAINNIIKKDFSSNRKTFYSEKHKHKLL